MTPRRVSVDGARCQGHARCVALAPQLFDIADDSENAHVLNNGEVTDSLVETAQLAVGVCPERAVVFQ